MSITSYISLRISNINYKNSKINTNHFITSTTELENNLNNIISYITEKGNTFSHAKLSNIKISNNEVTATLELDITKTNYISNIRIKGYKKFPKKFIKHYLRIKKQKKLILKDIEEKSNRLNNLRFTRELKKPEILFSKDSTIVYLYIKKHQSNSFEGFLGFSTNQENNKLDLNGNINLQLINNLNSGEEIYIKYQSTENQQKRTNIKLNLPYLFNSPISIRGELDIFKKDSSYTNNTQSILTQYTLTKNITIGAGLKFNSSNSLIKNSLNTIDYKTNAYTLNFNQITQNHTNTLFPIKTKTQLELSLARRKTAQESTNQQNIHLTSEYTFNLNTRNSFFIKNESHFLISSNILENELHYIGGINSIRGFQENSIPSSASNTLNTEYRIALNKNLYTHTVIDYSLTKNNTSKNFNNLFGFGIGFGLKTNKSLLRFIFANSKVSQEKIKFSNTKIHLSLSTFF